MRLLRKYVERIENNYEKMIFDDDFRQRNLMMIISFIIIFVSGTMSILNLIYNRKYLLIATSLITIMFIHIAYITVKYKKQNITSKIVMAIIILIFTFFLVTGGVSNFSPIWILILPISSVAIIKLKSAAIINIIMLLIVQAVFWTPLRHYIPASYSDVFSFRFPLVFLSIIVITFALEYERNFMQRKLHESKVTLEEMVKTDDLTKLENKRAFNVRLNNMWAEVYGENGDVSLLMIDIDYFKLYNDNYGHVQGDIILKRVAGIISETVSYKSENVTRWGGEEFVVLLPYINGDNAKYVAERIIKAIRLENIPHAFSKLPKKILTVSVGIASMHPNEENTPIELLTLSDKSLYEAKAKGRNCVGGIYVG